VSDIEDAKRRILEQVAEGSLSPSEAAERLAALNHTGEAGPAPDADTEPARTYERTVAASGPSSVETIKVRGTFRAVEIIGDPSVRDAVADGGHSARHEGDTLVIEAGTLEFDDDDDDDDDWFRFASGRAIGYRRRVGMRLRSGAALQVRMNPDLALDAKVEAGPLTIKQVHGPIKARVSAGPLKIDEFEGPIDLHVAAGPIKARGRLDRGESAIQCEAGSVNIQLSEDSSVRVKATATLGKVHLFGRRHDRDRDDREWHWEDLAGPGVNRIVGDVLGKLGGSHEATIGAGEGTLDVEVAMGAVHISTE
jgi:hypothetical protein